MTLHQHMEPAKATVKDTLLLHKIASPVHVTTSRVGPLSLWNFRIWENSIYTFGGAGFVHILYNIDC